MTDDPTQATPPHGRGDRRQNLVSHLWETPCSECAAAASMLLNDAKRLQKAHGEIERLRAELADLQEQASDAAEARDRDAGRMAE